jgi:hypothetical protein
MKRILDFLRPLADRVGVYPEALLGAGAVVVLFLAIMVILRSRRGGIARQVLLLARGGHAPATIARRTGLSRDAVAMALHVGGGRPILPPTARIAGTGPRPASFGEALQSASRHPLEALPEEWSRPVRTLPSRRARFLSFSR